MRAVGRGVAEIDIPSLNPVFTALRRRDNSLSFNYKERFHFCFHTIFGHLQTRKRAKISRTRHCSESEMNTARWEGHICWRDHFSFLTVYTWHESLKKPCCGGD